LVGPHPRLNWVRQFCATGHDRIDRGSLAYPVASKKPDRLDRLYAVRCSPKLWHASRCHFLQHPPRSRAAATMAFVPARSFSANSDRILRRFFPYCLLLVVVLRELQRIGRGRIYSGTNPVPSERRPVFEESLSRETQDPPSNLSGVSRTLTIAVATGFIAECSSTSGIHSAYFF
jgi:hypothetical protein